MRQPQGEAGCRYARGMCGKTGEVFRSSGHAGASAAGGFHLCRGGAQAGFVDAEIDACAPLAFFAAQTNVNFDAGRIVDFTRRATAYRHALRSRHEALCAQQGGAPEKLPPVALH